MIYNIFINFVDKQISGLFFLRETSGVYIILLNCIHMHNKF